MKISIVIPAYNTEPYLRDLLEELLRQREEYPQTEIIVVDDGNGYYWLDEIVTAVHIEHGGEARARNAGLDSATGDFLAWIDSDDKIFPDYLKTLYEAAEKDMDLTVFRWVCENGVKGHRFSDELPYYNVWSYLYRRELLTERFNENILYTCDYDWLRRTIKPEWSRQEVDHEIIIYNMSRTDSLTAQYNRGEIGIWKT